MLFDGIPFSVFQRNRADSSPVTPFIDFLEKRLGVGVFYDARDIPFGRVDLVRQFDLATLLLDRAVIKGFEPSTTFDDDPPIKLWSVTSASEHEGGAGGISSENDADALTGALAEALERYLWREMDDYAPRIRASVSEMLTSGKCIVAPERFVGYSREQRDADPARAFSEETLFTWIKGVSLVERKPTFVPAQTISAKREAKEPSIRSSNTTGLATWPSQAGARLRGALECIERDAYMIMWLNQLSLPRLRLDSLRKENSSLSRLIEKCERYRMNVHAVELLTDAPAHAVMVVLEDESGEQLRFSFGLKAGGNVTYTIEKALLEALRGHLIARNYAAKGAWDEHIAAKDIGHLERAHYWTTREHARHLEFLIAGKEKDIEPKEWENDTEEMHLARIVAWCRINQYECVSVALTGSKKNPTSLHVEMVTIPELQWMHLYEKDFMLGGTRWKSVPEKFGIKPRAEMFRERPHPFV